MPKITVYQARVYDITIDGYRTSQRWMTRQGASVAGLTVIEESQTEIDSHDLEPNEQWTYKGYNPHAARGFHKQVK